MSVLSSLNQRWGSDRYLVTLIIVPMALMLILMTSYMIATGRYLLPLMMVGLFMALILMWFVPPLWLLVLLNLVLPFHAAFVATFLSGRTLTPVGLVKDGLFVILVGAWLLRVWDGRYSIPWLSFFIVGPFLLWNAVRVVTSVDAGLFPALYDARLHVQYVFLLLIVESIILTVPDVRLVMRVLFLAAVLLATVSLGQALAARNSLALNFVYRLTGLAGLSGSNVVGVYVASTAVMEIGLVSDVESRRSRALLILGIAVCLLYTAFSYSRRAYVGSAIGLLILLAMSSKRECLSNSKYISILVVLLVAGLLLLGNTTVLWSLFQRIQDISLQSEGMQVRYAEWDQAMSSLSIMEYVTGRGLAIFGVASRLFDVPGGVMGHNYYVQLLVELGIVGLFSYLAIILYVIGQGIKLYNRLSDPGIKGLVRGSVAAIAVILFAGLFGTSNVSIPVASSLWCLAGLVMAMSRFHQETTIQG